MGQDIKDLPTPGRRKDLELLFQVLDHHGNPLEIESIWENCSGMFVQIQHNEEFKYGDTTQQTS